MAEYLPPEVANLLGLVDTYNVWENTKQAPRGFERYHPSAFGKCLRQMQFQRYHERGLIEPSNPSSPEPALCRIWQNGHSMHDRWRSYFEGLGVLKGYWQCGNPFCGAFDENGKCELSSNELIENISSLAKKRRTHGKNDLQGVFKPDKCICGWNKFHYHEVDVVSTELNFYGHCDLILDFSHFDTSHFNHIDQLFDIKHLPNKPIVIDMKSINYYDYQDVARGNPHEDYLVQLTIYANILDCDYGVLIYENKNNQKSCGFRVDKNTETVFAEIVRQATIMNEMVEITNEYGQPLGILPPPRYARESKKCDWCTFKDTCYSSPIWDDPNLDELKKEFYGELLK